MREYLLLAPPFYHPTMGLTQGLTRDVFLQQCKRRFGAANPERMRVEYWEWMIRHGVSTPWLVRQDLGLEPNYPSKGVDDGPDWCFKRFGMSRTSMPDGRTICISGEHEDSYDPDISIYNDVIVLRPAPGQSTVTPDSGEVEIYGYPPDIFPPTDFHSATFVGELIYIIGSLGYAESRVPGTTPVRILNTRTYEISVPATFGDAPGWIYKHHAAYDPALHAITVRGGNIEIRDPTKETPYDAAHRLNLRDMRWELVAAHERHRKFALESDDLDGEAGAAEFRPAGVPHTFLGQVDRGVETYLLDIRGVRVTFAEFFSLVQVSVEGDLPTELLEQVLREVAHNLSVATRSPWTIREVESFKGL